MSSHPGLITNFLYYRQSYMTCDNSFKIKKPFQFKLQFLFCFFIYWVRHSKQSEEVEEDILARVSKYVR